MVRVHGTGLVSVLECVAGGLTGSSEATFLSPSCPALKAFGGEALPQRRRKESAEWQELQIEVSLMPVGDLTQILDRVDHGDPKAAEELLPLVYAELRQLAACKLVHEARNRTLQPTALVHEAWLKLVKPGPQSWNSRGHFFCAAAEAMRRILIDRARMRNRVRHGAGLQQVNLQHIDVAVAADDDSLLLVSEALDKLAAEAPEKAKLVQLRFFAGLSIQDAARALGISPATAKRHWAFARAWLYAELRKLS